MKKNHNLYYDLGIDTSNNKSTCLDSDINKIKQMVNNSIHPAYAERMRNMKNKRKLPVVAAAATLVLGVSVFASSNIITSITNHSSAKPEFTSMPTAKECEKTFDFAPVLMEEFENGYTFDNGSIVYQSVNGEESSKMNDSKTLTLRYEKNDNELILSQEKYTSLINPSGDIASNFEGIDIYYNSYINKFVPSDYEMTENDKKSKESGEMLFSFGTDKVEIIEVKSANFVKDGVLINLYQMNGDLEKENLIDIAKEIIAE